MIYVKPPRGDILLNELHECVITRINYFLHRYLQDSSISKDHIKFQYLTLGTALDRTGHFMLRLLSAQAESLKEFVLASETKFIIERLEFMTAKQITQLLTTTLRHLNECGMNRKEGISEIKYIFSEIKSAFKCSHMDDFKHDEHCILYKLKVPFQMCLSLVASRELVMERGRAIVPCGKWKLFLKCLFESHLKEEIFQIQKSNSVLESLSDHRLQDLRDEVLNIFTRNSIKSSGGSGVIADELDRLKVMFPPCMMYLYNNLKSTHRLSHHARFNFSLFLKDIGMSLNESITFWRAEYSKPSRCLAKCCHTWQKNSGKYIYGIRHLYGLEGRRANYHVPACSKLQSTNLGPVEEGGCPFINFDQERLRNLLHRDLVGDGEEFNKIIQLSSGDQPQAACEYYRNALLKGAKKEPEMDSTLHRTPVEYFLILNKYFNLDVR